MPAEAWFPTIIYYDDIDFTPEVKADALAAIEEQIDREVFETRGTITASTATNRFHHDPRIRALIAEMRPSFERCIHEDLKVIRDKVRLFVARCWPVIQINNGDSGIRHFHRGSTFSCVLYLSTPEGAGSLEFYKPSVHACDGLPKTEFTPLTFQTVTYQAKENRMILFPSEIEHRRKRNEGEGEGKRLALALDLYATSAIEHFEAGRPHDEECLCLEDL